MWQNPQETHLFVWEILDEKLHFLCSVVKRSIYVCSDQHLLQKEVDYLTTKVLVKINDYPSETAENIIKNELRKENFNIANEPMTDITDSTETKLQLLSKMKGKDALIHLDV